MFRRRFCRRFSSNKSDCFKVLFGRAFTFKKMALDLASSLKLFFSRGAKAIKKLLVKYLLERFLKKKPLSNMWPMARCRVPMDDRDLPYAGNSEPMDNPTVKHEVEAGGVLYSYLAVSREGVALVVAKVDQTKDEDEELTGEVGGVVLCDVELKTRFL